MLKDLNIKIVMDKKSIIIFLWSLIVITISSSFSILYAQTNSDNISGNIGNSTTESLSPSIDNKSQTIKLFNPQDKPYGLSYEDHAINFWKWLISIPKDQHPESDLTGDRCTIGQENSNSTVFYLSGNSTDEITDELIKRTCEVPMGKGILIPVIVIEMSDKEEQNATIEDLSRIAKDDQDGVKSMYLKIDNKELKMEDLSKYRIHTDAFELNFPPKNVFEVSEGPAIAVADGHYIIFEPLSKGKHEVYWNSSLTCIEKGCPDPDYVQDVYYTIIVK